MKKIFLTISLLLITLAFIPSQTLAFHFFPFPSFRPFPTPKPSSTPKPSPQIKLKEIKIDGDNKKKKNQVELEFKNLDHVKSFTYTLVYTHNGITEGVVDNLSPNGVKKIKKVVFLGTCSAGVCTPHLNPINIKLQVDGLYLNNQSFSKAININ